MALPDPEHLAHCHGSGSSSTPRLLLFVALGAGKEGLALFLLCVVMLGHVLARLRWVIY